jgi:copper(I)-binding protein
MIRILALAALLCLSACTPKDGSPKIDDAWIREAPPGATVMAGYLRLHNPSRSTLRCDAVDGPDFGAAELHRSVVENGQSRMLPGQHIEAAPGTTAVLEPGGLHLMLFRPQRELRAGDETTLTLRCGEISISASFRIDNRS